MNAQLFSSLKNELLFESISKLHFLMFQLPDCK